MHVARGVGAIQPFEGRVRIAEPGMHEGERIRRNVPLAGCHLQRPEQITRFGRAPDRPRMYPVSDIGLLFWPESRAAVARAFKARS